MYPLKFQPIFQKRLWGGNRIRTLLNKPLPRGLEREPVGESWELADLPSGTVQKDSTGAAADGSLSSIITNGPLAGKTVHHAWNSELRTQDSELYFPLLIKFLDAQQDLSVQVHPDAAYARAHPGSHLKSEAWYILHAEPGAKIYKGLKPGTTQDQFRQALEGGKVEPLLNAIKVRPGDCHYLESGTIHALGAGILAAEVQTPSDTTFRVFDWNRLSPDGKPRALHINEALDCINFNPAPAPQPTPQPPNSPIAATRLVSCEHFTIDRLSAPQNTRQSLPGTLAIWIILEGQGVISCENAPPTAFTPGDTLLLPAGMTNPLLKTITTCNWLEAQIPPATKSSP